MEASLLGIKRSHDDASTSIMRREKELTGPRETILAAPMRRRPDVARRDHIPRLNQDPNAVTPVRVARVRSGLPSISAAEVSSSLRSSLAQQNANIFNGLRPASRPPPALDALPHGRFHGQFYDPIPTYCYPKEAFQPDGSTKPAVQLSSPWSSLKAPLGETKSWRNRTSKQLGDKRPKMDILNHKYNKVVFATGQSRTCSSCKEALTVAYHDEDGCYCKQCATKMLEPGLALSVPAANRRAKRPHFLDTIIGSEALSGQGGIMRREKSKTSSTIQQTRSKAKTKGAFEIAEAKKGLCRFVPIQKKFINKKHHLKPVPRAITEDKEAAVKEAVSQVAKRPPRTVKEISEEVTAKVMKAVKQRQDSRKEYPMQWSHFTDSHAAIGIDRRPEFRLASERHFGLDRTPIYTISEDLTCDEGTQRRLRLCAVMDRSPTLRSRTGET